MEPSEVEFLGEKELVSIVPNFNFGIIYLISGEVGPFRAGLPLRVPIWLALGLKQQQKCRIIQQDWMDPENLESLLADEKKDPKHLMRMPSNHFIDEAQMLLTAAPDDITDIDQIRTAIKDMWDSRMAKIRTSIIASIKTSGGHAKLDHLTAMEINSIRTLLPETFDVITHMTQVSQASSQSNDTLS